MPLQEQSRRDTASALLISVIIPCWKDDVPTERLVRKVKSWRIPGVKLEIIVGGASGCCQNRAAIEALGAHFAEAARRGRGSQMNAAAAIANGDVLLFQHADSELEPVHIQSLAVAVRELDVVGGAFHRAFDERHPGLRWLEGLERIHGRLFGTMYGDQSIFVRREIFSELNGYAEYPLMEDVDFSKRLRKVARVRLLDPPMRSSPRRHLQRGPWKTTLRNALILFLYHAGVSPDALYRMYYQQPQGPADAENAPRMLQTNP